MIPNAEAKDIFAKLKVNPFIDGPTQFLTKHFCREIAKVPEFRYIFRDNIDAYERFDYSIGQLPALRVYNVNYRKEQESHYIVGELNIDVLFPPSIRREEQQTFSDILSAALLQQLRRPQFFNTLRELVPGLNELGKVFDVNKDLCMVWENDELPLVKTKANLRIDLKAWDSYLEEQGRTKDDPFNVTLGELRTIAGRILPHDEDGNPQPYAETDFIVTTGGD